MIRVAREYGASVADCVAGTRLTHDDLIDPMREIAGEQELTVVRNILRALPPSIPFGFLAGQRYHLPGHGMLGFALMSCANGWSVVDLITRYFDLSLSFNRLAFEVEGNRGRLIYEDADNPEDLRAALVERDLGAAVAFERDSLRQVLPALDITLRAAPPAYADPFEAVFGVPARYGASVNCLEFDLALLDTRVPTADERGLRVSEEQCRELLEQRGARSGLSGRVHSRILGTLGQFPSMQTVAAELGMSTRTLRNRLVGEGTSFREIVEQARELLAEQLLAANVKIDSIAERLGYSDTSSFVNAFKRWKGMSPGRYRRQDRTQKER